MKRILLISLLTFLIACSKNKDGGTPPNPVDTLATGWTKGTQASIQSGSDIFFINNTTGFHVGGYNINRSTDGGTTWQKVYQSNNSIYNMAMGSTSNAIFITSPSGGNSKLIITTNGGNTFDSVMVADNNITDAFFVSSSIAYAVGRKCWKTFNAGITWTQLYDFGPTVPDLYKSLHFLNEQTGWWAGAGGVYKTTNGGINWTAQPTATFNFGNFGNVYFSDANYGYIADGISVGKSIDGGTSWNKIYTLLPGYHDLHFITKDIGYVTDNKYIFKTTDGGNTWTKEVILVSDNIIEVHFTDANHGWAALSSGSILKYER